MATSKNQQTPDTAVADAPAAVEGRCNAIISKKDGTKDRCSRPEGHSTSHLGWEQRRSNTAKLKQNRAVYTQWKHDNDPEYAAKQEAAKAKKVERLLALAEELGYEVTPPKAN